MYNRNINELLLLVCSLPVGRLNGVRFDAISRMYLALNDLICTGYADDYTNRRTVTEKIDALFHAQDCSTIGGLCRIYRLVKEASATLYGEKDERCSRSFRRLLGNYLRRPNPAEELDAMQCVVYESGGIQKGNMESDYYSFFRERCEAWRKDLTIAGNWPHVPEEDALRRMALLRDNFYVFADGRFNDTARRAYAYYRSRLVLPDRMEPGRLSLFGGWYDLLRDPGLFPREQELMIRIAAAMEESAETARPDSDEYYIAVSYAVVQKCSVLMDDTSGGNKLSVDNIS